VEYAVADKQELLHFVLAHRDAGTLTGKLLKKIRKQALALIFETRQGDFVDLDLVWIAAGCPKDKTPYAWLNGPGKATVGALAEEMGCDPSDLVVKDDRTIN
jgi:hypothetical protein